MNQPPPRQPGLPATGQPLDPPFWLEQPSPAQVEPALSVLLTGKVQPDAYAARQFRHFAQQHGMSLEQLFWAGDASGPLLAALLVPNVGRTAMLLLSPLNRRADIALCARIVDSLCQHQDPAGLRLVQGLLEPMQQYEAQALEQAGFFRLAELLYMQQRALAPTQPLVLDDGISLCHWSEEQRGLFEKAILASYQQTLDCPRLLGLRSIEDIVASHMGAGTFQPQLWFALHHQGQPVGVMLLNLGGDGQSMELVYLGLSPAWRGRGLGKQLVRFGLGLCRSYGATSMILAVDSANEPALRLYKQLGFAAYGHKVALLRVLP